MPFQEFTRTASLPKVFDMLHKVFVKHTIIGISIPKCASVKAL